MTIPAIAIFWHLPVVADAHVGHKMGIRKKK